MAIEGKIMKFKLNNQDLTLLKSLLEKLNINSMKVNRGKIKLYKHVLAKINEYAEDEKEVLKASVLINDDGSFKKNKDDTIQLKEGKTYEQVNQQLMELAQEEVILEAGEYESRYATFMDWLSNCDEELTMAEIILVDNLLEQFEEQKGE